MLAVLRECEYSASMFVGLLLYLNNSIPASLAHESPGVIVLLSAGPQRYALVAVYCTYLAGVVTVLSAQSERTLLCKSAAPVATGCALHHQNAHCYCTVIGLQ